MEAHARDGWPFATLPGPCRFPWLRVVLGPPGESGAYRPAPAQSSGSQSSRCPRRSAAAQRRGGCRCVGPSFSMVWIWGPRQGTTARLLVTARTCAGSGSRRSISSRTNACIRLALRRPPVCRPMLLCRLSTCAVCWRTTGERVRQTSRTALSAWGPWPPRATHPVSASKGVHRLCTHTVAHD